MNCCFKVPAAYAPVDTTQKTTKYSDILVGKINCCFEIHAAYTPVDTTQKTTKYSHATVGKPAFCALSSDDSTDSGGSKCICVDCALPISDSKYGGYTCACDNAMIPPGCMDGSIFL